MKLELIDSYELTEQPDQQSPTVATDGVRFLVVKQTDMGRVFEVKPIISSVKGGYLPFPSEVPVTQISATFPVVGILMYRTAYVGYVPQREPGNVSWHIIGNAVKRIVVSADKMAVILTDTIKVYKISYVKEKTSSNYGRMKKRELVREINLSGFKFETHFQGYFNENGYLILVGDTQTMVVPPNESEGVSTYAYTGALDVTGDFTSLDYEHTTDVFGNEVDSSQLMVIPCHTCPTPFGRFLFYIANTRNVCVTFSSGYNPHLNETLLFSDKNGKFSMIEKKLRFLAVHEVSLQHIPTKISVYHVDTIESGDVSMIQPRRVDSEFHRKMVIYQLTLALCPSVKSKARFGINKLSRKVIQDFKDNTVLFDSGFLNTFLEKFKSSSCVYWCELAGPQLFLSLFEIEFVHMPDGKIAVVHQFICIDDHMATFCMWELFRHLFGKLTPSVRKVQLQNNLWTCFDDAILESGHLENDAMIFDLKWTALKHMPKSLFTDENPPCKRIKTVA